MNDIIIGIDPGASGALATRHRDGAFSVHDLCDARAHIKYAARVAKKTGEQVFAYIEDPPAFVVRRGRWNVKKQTRENVMQNSKSMLKFGKSCGWCLGVCEEAGFAVELVTVRDWRARVRAFVQYRHPNPKIMTRQWLAGEHPELYAMCLGPRGGYKDGRGDAFGVLLYGVEHNRLPDVLKPNPPQAERTI